MGLVGFDPTWLTIMGLDVPRGVDLRFCRSRWLKLRTNPGRRLGVVSPPERVAAHHTGKIHGTEGVALTQLPSGGLNPGRA